MDYLKAKEIDLVVNIPKDATEEELENDYTIRRAAVDHGVPLITNLQLAQRLAHQPRLQAHVGVAHIPLKLR